MTAVKPETEFESNSCSDIEYDNQNGGLCTFIPKTRLFDCKEGFHTQTGICFSNDSQLACKNDWIDKSTTKASCISKGSYCQHRDGILSFLRGIDCKNCRGVEKTRYTWATGSPRSLKAKTSAKSTVPDAVDLFPVVTTSVGRVRARNFVNRIQRLLFSLLQLFKAFSCDCMEKEIPCYAQLITVPFGDYIVDSNLHTQLNCIFLDPQLRISNQIVTVTVKMYSAANFISNNTLAVTGNLVQRRDGHFAESNVQQLQKNGNPLASYAIVYNFDGGSVFGQIIGNGFEYTPSATTYSSAQI